MLTTLLLYLGISIGLNILMFIPAYFFQTDKLTDMTYSLSFMLIALGLIIQFPINTAQWLLIILLFGWAVRLGIFLWNRINFMGRDRRFDSIRVSVVSFFKFFMLQAFTAWILLVPLIIFISNGYDRISYPLIAIWLFGFIIELLADRQKFRFKKNPQNKDDFIRSGLWKYSRHPNYLGEIIIWFAFTGIMFPSLSWTEFMLSLSGPIFISCMLIFITGIPPLEKSADKRWGDREDYQKYKENTALLITGIF